MIRVVNLSPAIDITYELENLKLGNSLRVQKVHKVPGGKGVNVARVIHAGNRKVQLVLPLGGQSGNWIKEQLQTQDLDIKELPIEGETRSCVAVVAQEVTVLNEPAAELTEAEFQQLLSLLSEPAKVSVLSGSLPKNLSSNQVEQLIQTLRRSSEKLLVDTSGENLLLAAKHQPDLLKPNREEALQATGKPSIELAIAELLALGAKAVLLSDGENGALLAKTNRVQRAKAPRAVGNPTGAGDAMVALAAIALAENLSDGELLRTSVAAGTLAVAEPVAGQINWSRLSDLAKQIELEEQ